MRCYVVSDVLVVKESLGSCVTGGPCVALCARDELVDNGDCVTVKAKLR